MIQILSAQIEFSCFRDSQFDSSKGAKTLIFNLLFLYLRHSSLVKKKLIPKSSFIMKKEIETHKLFRLKCIKRLKRINCVLKPNQKSTVAKLYNPILRLHVLKIINARIRVLKLIE